MPGTRPGMTLDGRGNLMRKLILIAALIAAALGCGAVASAQGFPTRPITIVVPYPPGGPTDVVARILAERMRQSFGQHRGGAGRARGERRLYAEPGQFRLACPQRGALCVALRPAQRFRAGCAA